jgi:hypothetical protein
MKLIAQDGEWVLMATGETPQEVTCASVSGNGLEARRYNLRVETPAFSDRRNKSS